MADLQYNGVKEMVKYEDTLEEIENSLGMVPGFMKLVDEMMEEMLSQVETAGEIRAGRKARTVCCGVLVDTDTAPVARSITGEQFFVCNENCRKFIETATPEHIYEIASQ